MVSNGQATWPFFLEWEKRAVRGYSASEALLGVREVAATSGARREPGTRRLLVERSGARVLPPSARGVKGGALGSGRTYPSPAGQPRGIHFPDDLLRPWAWTRLFCRPPGAPSCGSATASPSRELHATTCWRGGACTRMGKSTLMHHVVAHKLKEKAEGRDADAIVVIDPHTDLVEGLLRHVPPSLADQVRLIDLADDRGRAWHQPLGHEDIFR